MKKLSMKKAEKCWKDEAHKEQQQSNIKWTMIMLLLFILKVEK